MNRPGQTISSLAAPDRRFGLIFIALLSVAALSPALFVEFPAMPDYPNYVARLYLVATDGAPDVNPFYEVVRLPISNLAFDLLVPLLAPLTGVPLATWLMKGFFDRIPHEIEQAAMIDGCTRLTALRQARDVGGQCDFCRNPH